ncbi:MAG: hypothetical protein OYH77_01805 [Pseudomonadota bacterium]|nr:hypothetical protein [Pseudomonadota bacterium]
MLLTPVQQTAGGMNSYFDQLGAFFVICFLFVNYPHFIASYKLAYSKGVRFIGRNWFQLLFVPLLLTAMIATAYVFFDSSPFIVKHINEALGFVGINTQIVSPAQEHGVEMMALLLDLMYISVGWHYSKQVYGCMMVYAHYNSYKLTHIQRHIAKWSVLGIWFVNYFSYHTYAGSGDFYGIAMNGIGLGEVPKLISWAGFGLIIACACYFIFWQNYRRYQQLPSVNFLVPFVAYSIWFLPPFNQPFFYMTAVPFFHSLQYLVFVYRIEKEKLIATDVSANRKNIIATALIMLLIIGGWLSFNLVPELLDEVTGISSIHNVAFFVAAAHIFINIHHYFIDNVIWRFDNTDIKKYLLN